MTTFDDDYEVLTEGTSSCQPLYNYVTVLMGIHRLWSVSIKSIISSIAVLAAMNSEPICTIGWHLVYTIHVRFVHQMEDSSYSSTRDKIMLHIYINNMQYGWLPFPVVMDNHQVSLQLIYQTWMYPNCIQGWGSPSSLEYECGTKKMFHFENVPNN